jgi:hypothetical protein
VFVVGLSERVSVVSSLSSRSLSALRNVHGQPAEPGRLGNECEGTLFVELCHLSSHRFAA